MSTSTDAPVEHFGDPRCAICTDRRRADLETALFRGTQSVRAIAREFEVSRDSLRRHALRHIDTARQADLFSETPGLRALDLVTQLVDVIQHAEEVRKDADQRGDDRTALAASRVITTTTEQLADRLGVRKGDAIANLAEADALAHGLQVATEATPDVGHLVADALDEIGNVAMARLLRTYATRAEKKLAAPLTP